MFQFLIFSICIGGSIWVCRAAQSYLPPIAFPSTGFAHLTPTTQNTVRTVPVSTPIDDVLTNAQEAIYRFYEMRSYADKELDSSLLSTVLSGDALGQQEGVIETLRGKNCYWIFANQDIEFHNWKITNPNYVTIDVTVWEDADLYCNDHHDPASYTHDDSYGVRFTVKRIDTRWYVTGREVIK